MTGSISFYHRGMLARTTTTEDDVWVTDLYLNGERKYSLTWLEEFNSGKLKTIIDNLVYQVPEGDDVIIYQNIIACSLFQNGNWITYFYNDGEYISKVIWVGGYTEDSIKRYIDKNILPFIFSGCDF